MNSNISNFVDLLKTFGFCRSVGVYDCIANVIGVKVRKKMDALFCLGLYVCDCLSECLCDEFDWNPLE